VIKVEIAVDSKSFNEAVIEAVKALDLVPKSTLTGRTISLDEFRKKYCGGKSRDWLKSRSFTHLSQILYKTFILAMDQDSSFLKDQQPSGWRNTEKRLSGMVRKQNKKTDWLTVVFCVVMFPTWAILLSVLCYNFWSWVISIAH
jgi:hypothetical protein